MWPVVLFKVHVGMMQFGQQIGFEAFLLDMRQEHNRANIIYI